MTHRHGANNNTVQFLHGKSPRAVLKTFKNQNGAKQCFDREIEFYQHCRSLNLTTTPQLFDYDRKELTITLELVGGKSPQHISSEDLPKICSFLAAINNVGTVNSSNYCSTAAEAIITVSDFAKHLIHRSTVLERTIEYTPTGLREALTKVICRLKTNPPTIGGQIINPSDLGAHNILCSDGEFKFIDFEYSGRDSTFKCAYDFVLHPANKISISKFREMAQQIADALKQKNFTFREMDLCSFCVWWILRLLSGISNETIDRRIDNGLLKLSEREAYVAQRVAHISYFWDIYNEFMA